MEHVTEALYMAAAAGLFLLAISLMYVSGRSVDRMFAEEQAVSQPGTLMWEELNHV